MCKRIVDFGTELRARKTRFRSSRLSHSDQRDETRVLPSRKKIDEKFFQVDFFTSTFDIVEKYVVYVQNDDLFIYLFIEVHLDTRL